MHEEIGAGDALGDGAGRGVAFRPSPAVAVRSGSEVNSADGVGVGIPAEQVFDAGAIRPGQVALSTALRPARPSCARGNG
jgi:hypothetical protein